MRDQPAARSPGDRDSGLTERAVSGTDAAALGLTAQRFLATHPLPVVVFDGRTLELIDLNGAAQDAFGLNPGALHGLSVVDLHPQALRTTLRRLYSTTSAPYVLPEGAGRSVRMLLSTGEEFEAVVSVLPVDHGDRPERLMIVSDVTKRRQDDSAAEARLALEQRVDYLANFDPVTDLPNRQRFESLLLDLLAAARGKDKSLALMFLELHGFRLIYDALGQEAADDLLRAATRRLTATLNGALISRFGGDEFAVATRPLNGTVEATEMAQTVVAELVRPLKLGERTVTFRPRVGVAVFPEHAETPSALMRAASQAKFRAKGARGPSFAVFTPAMQVRAADRLGLEGELRQAIEERQLTLFYQPRVRLADAGLASVEALVRWRHPTRGLISPDTFVPLAEESGLINALGREVLDLATAQLRLWQDAGFAVPRVAVNLSPLELRGGGLVERVRGALNKARLAPDRLELEVTETAALVDKSRGAEVLKELRSFGVHVILDDFGTGHASLAHLRELPVDAIKLDRGFISASGDPAADPGADQAILKAVTTLGSALGVPVTAEGVETEEQLRAVIAAGCHAVQGFLISPPVAPALVQDAARRGTLAFDRNLVALRARSPRF